MVFKTVHPKLYIKLDGEDEVEASEAIPGLLFLGDDESPAIATSYQQNIGRDGQMIQTINYDKNVINAKFWLHFGDWYNYKLAKHDIYKLFNSRKTMRIRTDAEPTIVKYVVPASFEIAPSEDGSHDIVFTIAFDNPSGYKYSMVRSDELYVYNSLWQLGMSLPINEELAYTNSKSNFKIYNASDVEIDPYFQNHDLVIKTNFSGKNITIKNNTTSSSWTYNKPATKSDNIILDGIATTLNSKPASANTDYGNITLAPGWNDISVTGTTDFSTTFSFPFVYIG